MALQAAVGEENDGVVGEGDDGDVEAIGGSGSVDKGEGENSEADHRGDASVDDNRFVWVALAGARDLGVGKGAQDQDSQGQASTLRALYYYRSQSITALGQILLAASLSSPFPAERLLTGHQECMAVQVKKYVYAACTHCRMCCCLLPRFDSPIPTQT